MVGVHAGELYFLFPFVARRMKRQLAKEESLAVACFRRGILRLRKPRRPLPKRRKKASRSALPSTGEGLYALSILVPFAAMALFNNPRFREYWSSPNVPRDPETGKETVTELGSDVADVAAYFLARSWTPFRLPVFLLGSLFAARRRRACVGTGRTKAKT